MPEPWERQEGETTKAFYAFTIYRDLDHKRTLSKTCTNYMETTSRTRSCLRTIGGWSTKFGWVKRAQAYDDYVDALIREESEKAVKEMQKRHLTLGMALQAKGAAKLQDLDGKKMKVRDAISAITQGTRLERLIRGEPTERVKGEMVTTIRGPDLMPWESIPEAKASIDRIKEKLREEKKHEQDHA